jgi:hypothetical protein
MKRKPTHEVIEIGKINFSGNIVPEAWFQAIKNNGKTNLNAVMILSEIVWWYRPQEIRDEFSGNVIEIVRKFKGEFLQRSHQSFAAKFGITKRQSYDACKLLERLGLIELILKKRVTLPNGEILGNVLYIKVLPKNIAKITTPLSPPGDRVHSPGDSSHLESEPYHLQVGHIQEITTEITTETISEKFKENKRPSIVSQTDGVVRTANAAAPPLSKNGHGEEKKLPQPLQLEPEAGNPPLELSLSTQTKPEQDKRSIDKGAAGAAARAKKTILAQTSQPQHCPDGFKAWWNLFRGHAQKNNLKPGTRSESVAAWDVLHEAAQQIATGGTSLAEAIINGTEHYWEREGMGSFPTVKHGCRFLAKLDWLEATEWHHVHQSGGAQLAQGGLETFLACWNQDKPMTWPQADESDLSLATSQLERFIASGPNAIERFQGALRYVRRDEYWSLQRTLTFGEFLSARQLSDWSKKQANAESLGIGDRVGGLADAAKRAKRQAELNQILLELQEEDARKQ